MILTPWRQLPLIIQTILKKQEFSNREMRFVLLELKVQNFLLFALKF